MKESVEPVTKTCTFISLSNDNVSFGTNAQIIGYLLQTFAHAFSREGPQFWTQQEFFKQPIL